MLTLPPAVSDAERAVTQFKRQLHASTMAKIIRLAMSRRYVSPGDLPEDAVPDADRQGVASNAWNSLAALEIIERLPLGFTSETDGIFGGRIKNSNPRAKGRWVACYRLRSRALALTWLERNGFAVEETAVMMEKREQQELAV